MRSDSTVAPDTLRAYQSTEYRVLGDAGFTLRIGQASAELLDAHQRHGVTCSAFLTACNPFSQLTDAEVNAARQKELVAELDRRSFAYVYGIGQHPGNEWPGEDSFLIFGLEIAAAKELAARFEQYAFVWSGADAVPELVLLR